VPDDDISLTELHDFVLERVTEVPAARRVVLLRTLAVVIGSAELARELRAIATDLERIERRQKKLLLNFRASRGAK
jgi:hypothetical protein